ncbi:MAG: hypothetical protein Q4G58_11305 [bacterium]|nr:hypothetical protein [bacterium]
MKNNYVLSVIIKVSPETTAKKLEKTIHSVNDQFGSDTVQLIAVMDADKERELGSILNAYEGKVEVATEAALCNVKGTYLNILTAGEYWEENSLNEVKELLEAGTMELIEDASAKRVGEPGIHYIENEASVFMMDLAPIFIHRKYKEVALSLVEAKVFDRLLGITKLHLQAGTYLSKEGISVKYKETVIRVEKDWYTEKVKQFANAAMTMAKEAYGKDLFYVQNIIMHLFSACLKDKLHKELSNEEQEAFLTFLKECIMDMDDMIISKGGLNAALRMYVFELKYGKEVWDQLQYRKGKIKFRNLVVFNLTNAFMIKKIQKKTIGDKIEVCLTINNPLEQKFTYCIADHSGNRYPLEKDMDVMDRIKTECFGKVLTKEVVYKAVVPSSIENAMTYEYHCLNYYFGSMQMKEKV